MTNEATAHPLPGAGRPLRPDTRSPTVLLLAATLLGGCGGSSNPRTAPAPDTAEADTAPTTAPALADGALPEALPTTQNEPPGPVSAAAAAPEPTAAAEPTASPDPAAVAAPPPAPPEPAPEPAAQPAPDIAPAPSPPPPAATPQGRGQGTVAPEPVPFDYPLAAILEGLRVSSAQYTAYQTPIDTFGGAVYIAGVEPGPDGDGPGKALHTIVRRGVPSGEGWSWSSALVDDRTLHDPWHAPPGIGVDRDGHVHVAYNMHNFPWQYKVSNRANDLGGGFRYLGESVDDRALAAFVDQDRTDFPTAGNAPIPGNQITYPAFFRDARDELYVTYRRAARPARAFAERTMSAAIARYERADDSWSAIGGELPIGPDDAEGDGTPPDPPALLAGQSGWTAYPPRLEFGPDNELHAFWLWRRGVAGSTQIRPCHLVSDDGTHFRTASGQPVALPARPDDCGNIGVEGSRPFHTVGDTAIDSRGRLHLLLSPVSGPRIIRYRDNGAWREMTSPDYATEIFFDAEDNLWAIGSGLSIQRRAAGASTWRAVHTDASPSQCYPRVVTDGPRRTAFIHTRGCSDDVVEVWRLGLLRPGG